MFVDVVSPVITPHHTMRQSPLLILSATLMSCNMPISADASIICAKGSHCLTPYVNPSSLWLMWPGAVAYKLIRVIQTRNLVAVWHHSMGTWTTDQLIPAALEWLATHQHLSLMSQINVHSESPVVSFLWLYKTSYTDVTYSPRYTHTPLTLWPFYIIMHYMTCW